MLKVQSIEAPQDAPQSGDRITTLLAEPGEFPVFLPGQCFTLVASHQCGKFPLSGCQAEQVGMADQVTGMFVMAVKGDDTADIVQERSRFQNTALILLDSPLPCRSASTTMQRIEFVPMSMAASLVVSLGKDLIRTQGLDWAFEI
jgi:hypothetical protein